MLITTYHKPEENGAEGVGGALTIKSIKSVSLKNKISSEQYPKQFIYVRFPLNKQ